MMTSIAEVQTVAHQYLDWVIAMAIISVWCFQLDGVFIGATWTRAMRNTMAVSTALYVGCVLLTVPVFGNHGLWFSFILFFAFRGITLAFHYHALEPRMGAS